MIYGYILSFTFSTLLPLVVVIGVLRKIKANLWLLTAGIVTYIASQVIYFIFLFFFSYVSDSLPNTQGFLFLIMVLSALIIAICEDGSRWLAFRFLKKNAESWQAAVTMGLGFGAIASVAMGATMVQEFRYVMQITTPGLIEGLSLSAAEQEVLRAQQALLVATPWYEPATRGMVFFLSFLIQVLFTIMIWKGISQRSWKWLLSAFGVHTLFEFIVLLLRQSGVSPLMNVLVVLVFGALLAAVLYQLLFKQWIRDHETARAAARKDI